MRDPAVGLCSDCCHSRVVRSQRSTFYMCQRSFTDPAFPKYPRLPVIACVGYELAPPEEKPDDKVAE